MAQKKIDIKFNVDDKSVKIAGEETMKLSHQVRLLKAELASGKYSQEEFEILATKLNDVQDQMAQTKTRSGDLLTSLQLIPGPIGEIASKFNGAVALLKQFSGFSLKDLKFQFKETLNDVKDIGSGLAKATGLASLFGKSVEGAKDGMNAVGEGVKGATTQVGNFRKALITTGIGAIVVAVGLIVAYWEDIVGLVNGVSSEQKDLNELAQENLDIENKKLSDLEGSTNQLKLQGKSEKEILQLKIKQTDEAIAAAEINLQNAEDTKKAQVEASQRNKDILKGLLNFASLPITMILGSIDLISEGLVKLGVLSEATTLRDDLFDWTASLVFDPEEVEKTGQETVQAASDSLNQLKEKRAGYQLAVQEQDKAAGQKADETRKDNDAKRLEAQKILADAELQLKSKKDQELAAVEADYQAKLLKLKEGGLVDDGKLKELYEQKKQEINDKYKAEELKREQDLQNQLNKLQAGRTESLMDDAQVEIEIVRQKYATLLADAERNGQDLVKLKALQAAEIQKIEETAAKAEQDRIFKNITDTNQKEQDALYQRSIFNEEFEIQRNELFTQQEQKLKESFDKKEISEEQYNEGVKALANARVSIEEQEQAAKSAALASYADALGSIAQLAGENTKYGKLLSVASTLISTYLAAQEAYRSQMAIATPDAPIRAALAAGVAVAQGLARVAAIRKTEVPPPPTKPGGTEISVSASSNPQPIQVVARRAQGGFVYGDGGSMTDSIPAMLSNGEFVMNAKSAAMFSPMLTAMNNMGNLPNTSVPQSLGNQSLVDVMSQSVNNRPIKTYVTAQDMSNQQQFDRTIKSRSLI